MKRYAVIAIYPETKRRLEAFRQRGETFDQVLNRILDEASPPVPQRSASRLWGCKKYELWLVEKKVVE